MELADRLPFCPRCTYPFTGLPEAHQCPECGQAYDEKSRLWQSTEQVRRKRRKVILITGIMNLAIGCYIAGFAMFQSNALLRSGLILGGTLNVVLGILNTLKWHRDSDPPLFVATMPEGIWYSIGGNRALFISWREIQSVDGRSQPDGYSLRIHLISEGRLDIPNGLIGTSEIHDAIDSITARIGAN